MAVIESCFGPNHQRRLAQTCSGAAIAHKIQERAYGGLSRVHQRLLDQLVRAARAKPNGRRNTKIAKYQGGIPFTYGPLAYFLKNRIYLGEMHYGGKWFKGEHEAILDRGTFERVQELLKSNALKCKVKYSDSGALLQGKLFDDKGNRMGPTFSSKNGIRYRFYFSTAVVRDIATACR